MPINPIRKYNPPANANLRFGLSSNSLSLLFLIRSKSKKSIKAIKAIICSGEKGINLSEKIGAVRKKELNISILEIIQDRKKTIVKYKTLLGINFFNI